MSSRIGLFGSKLYMLAILNLLIAAPASAEEYTDEKSLGPVKVLTTLSPSDPRLGDELSLTIDVTAEEDVEVLMPEFADVVSGFPISQYLPKQTVTPAGKSRFTVRYVFQVEFSGKQVIQPIAIEFIDNRDGKQAAPEDYDAYELLTERIEFSVTSVLVTSVDEELNPPLPELDLPAESIAKSSYLVLGFVIAAGMLAATGFLLWVRNRNDIRKANAYELAKRQLDSIVAAGSRISVDEFYVETSAVIRRYLEIRFELAAPELTTDEFLQIAPSESELSKEHQVLLSEFLSQADLVKFSGKDASEGEMRCSTELAYKFLEETRAEAPEVVLENSEAFHDHNAKPSITQESSHV